jgi:hypothetical protein
VGVKKPTESSTPQKTEPIPKPIPSTPKASEVGGGNSVKTQPVTTGKPETTLKPPSTVQPTASQSPSVGVKKDGVIPSKEKSKSQAKVSGLRFLVLRFYAIYFGNLLLLT